MASGRAADPGRPRLSGWRPGRFLALLLGAALAAAAAGCATVPSGGAPQSLPGNNGQPQAFVQPLPPPGPSVGWLQQDVIYGFLHASASFALDPGAAKLYMAPNVTWRPDEDVVTVVSSVTLTKTKQASLTVRTGGDQVVTFDVTGQRVASLSSSGQYINQSGPTTTYQFTLARYNDGWRIQSIDAPPSVSRSSGTPLLLFQTDFDQVFQSRNLYFFSPKSHAQGDLVPDPVFTPVQGALSTADLAKRLVKGLLNGSQNAPASSWLSGATSTAFPPGTQLISVTVNNLNAVVNLGGPAPFDSPAAMQQMYIQLYETLTSSFYAPPIADSVELQFQGKPLHVQRSQYSVPAVGDNDAPLYFAAGGLVYASSGSRKPLEVAGPAQFPSYGGVTAVAASPDSRPQLAIATSSAQGCIIAVGRPGGGSPFSSYRLPRGAASCTALSWDSAGDLWAVAGSRIWVIQPGRVPMPVTSPFGTSAAAPAVLALRIAPDNVRAALLVRMPGNSGNQVFLAAVSYTRTGVSIGPPDPIGNGGLSDPKAVNWYTPYYLVVLDGSELYEVPLTGGPATPILPVPRGTNSISTNGAAIAVGTTAGLVYTSGQDGSWPGLARGAFPAYPG